MNPYPPFPRGFYRGPGTFGIHEHAGNTSLEWATFALVLLIVLTLGALIVARLADGPPRRRFRMRGGPDPLEVVRMRFASGQITRDEYLQVTSDLTAHHGPPPPEPAT
jgi:uncharacterized membrane protein